MKRSGDRVIARDRVIGSDRFLRSNVPEVSHATPTLVILSVAPQEILHQDTDGRGVEGSRRSVGLEHRIREFSRELPDASVIKYASSGSFDSPLSRVAGLELAQDDRGRVRRAEKSSSKTIQCVRDLYWTVIATLREIFDEAAYDRFLLRTNARRSVESYRMFLDEREAGIARRPRCC